MTNDQNKRRVWLTPEDRATWQDLHDSSLDDALARRSITLMLALDTTLREILEGDGKGLSKKQRELVEREYQRRGRRSMESKMVLRLDNSIHTLRARNHVLFGVAKEAVAMLKGEHVHICKNMEPWQECRACVVERMAADLRGSES